MTNDDTGGMGKLADETKDEVDKELRDEETAVLKDTTVDLESLRPQVSDPEAFDKLIQAVNTATQRNESIAQISQRIKDLGEGVVKVAKEAAVLIK